MLRFPSAHVCSSRAHSPRAFARCTRAFVGRSARPAIAFLVVLLSSPQLGEGESPQAPISPYTSAPGASTPPGNRPIRTVVRFQAEAGGPHFERADRILPTADPLRVLAAGRFTGQACPELLLWSRSERAAFLWSPSRPAALSRWQIEGDLTGAPVQEVDLERDGFTDLLVEQQPGRVVDFHSDGALGFLPAVPVPLPASNPIERSWFFALSDATLARVEGDPFINAKKLNVLVALFHLPEPYLRGSSHVLRVAGPLAGFGKNRELGLLLQDASTPYLLHGYFPRSPTLWAELPSADDWVLRTADFNGDLLQDVLAAGARANGWWMFIGTAQGGLGMRTDPLYAAATPQGELAAADLDCDGAADLVHREVTAGVLRVSYSRLSRRVSNVLLETARGERRSGDNGEIELDGAFSGYLPVRPFHERINFGEQRVSSSGRAGYELQEVAFYGTERHTSDGSAVPIGRRYGPGPAAPGPYVCLGFTPGELDSQWSSLLMDCPPAHALVSIGLEATVKGDSARQRGCCPLPFDDILDTERVEASGSCPEGTIATGISKGASCISCPERLICRRINAHRYSLGPETEGVYWGDGRFREKSSRKVARGMVPPALVHSLGRSAIHYGAREGCLGLPWGSLLTRLSTGDTCDASRFRQLRYAESGAEVPMFPPCAEVADRRSPMSGCRDSVRLKASR